jgi:hypothetical protein
MGLSAGDANLYRYVTNDTPNSTDPSGLFGPGPVIADVAAYAAAKQRQITNQIPNDLAVQKYSGSEYYYATLPHTDKSWDRINQGCVGLYKIRLNTDRPLGIPGMRCFKTLEQALAYQRSLGGPRQATVLVYQFSSTPENNAIFNQSRPSGGKPGEIARPPDGWPLYVNYVTLVQPRPFGYNGYDGRPYFEWMDHGFSKPFPTVYHSGKPGYPNLSNIYFVTPRPLQTIPIPIHNLPPYYYNPGGN